MIKLGKQRIDIGVLKIKCRHLHFVLVEDITIGNITLRTVSPNQIVDTVDTLQVHGNTLEPIGNFAGHWVALETAGLLKIRELGNFHSVEPHLPADPPRPERGRLPVIFNETHIMHLSVDAE